MLLRRLTATTTSRGDVDTDVDRAAFKRGPQASHQLNPALDVDRDRLKHWTPRRARCDDWDCAEDDDASWLSRQPPASSFDTVKRQLDLNIVLSNYIKHRLSKDEDPSN